VGGCNQEKGNQEMQLGNAWAGLANELQVRVLHMCFSKHSAGTMATGLANAHKLQRSCVC
jgi:hypothetical protein